MPVEFFTCSYTEFRPQMGVPVRTSLGHPRFKLRYGLVHAMPMLAPRRDMFHLDEEAFEVAYHAMLDKTGVQKILAAGKAIVEQEDDHRLVLLCFERLNEPGKWCHRSSFGRWFLIQTGEEVRELGARGRTSEQLGFL